MKNLDWMAGAACATLPDPEVMQDEDRVEEARLECASCPAQKACLSYALDNPDLSAWGVWAGTTPRQRGYMLRRLGRQLPTRDVDLEMDCE